MSRVARGLLMLVVPLACGGTLWAQSPQVQPAASSLPPEDAQDVVFLGPLRPVLVRLQITIDGRPFRAVWQERFDQLFDQEDRDRAGRVKLEQAREILNGMNGALADAPEVDIEPLAIDGTIDRPTLMSFAAVAYPPFSVRRRAVIAQGSALALFPLLDVNGDQQLSAEELKAASTRLLQRDFDDDRVITRAELILDPKALAAASAPSEESEDLDPGEGWEDLDPIESPMIVVDKNLTRGTLGERLLKHYDRNHDGTIAASSTPAEMVLAPELFSQLDVNGDGLLDRAELGGFADRSADIQMTMAMGRVSGRGSARRSRPRAPEGMRVRETLQGGYKLELGDALVDFKRNNRDPQQTDLVEMRTLDRDNNQYLDADEAAAGGIGEQAFAAMDSNSDGKVFRGELSSFMTRQNSAAAVRLQLQIEDSGQDLFQLLDFDSDGVLSPRELKDAANVLASDDKNGDGLLGGDELPQQIKMELARGLDERPDAQMRVARSPAARSTAKTPTSGPLWFRKMDRNNDGDISPHEFVGPLSAFSKLDTNGDGLIDREEAEAARRE